MQRFLTISFTYVGLLVVITHNVSAQTVNPPNINTDIRSRLQNRATVQIPGVDAAKAARIKAGANFDPSRIRINAGANKNANVGAGGGNIRIDSSTKAQIEARRGNKSPQPNANKNQCKRRSENVAPGGRKT